MSNDTQWLYGNWYNLGWGGVEIDINGQRLDFNPEFEEKRDVLVYFKNRKNILKLPNMTVYKHIKTLCRGLKWYVLQ